MNTLILFFVLITNQQSPIKSLQPVIEEFKEKLYQNDAFSDETCNEMIEELEKIIQGL